MDKLYVVIILVLMAIVAFLVIRLYDEHKRIKSMTSSVAKTLEDKKRLQIFSEKNDDLASLSFQINNLANLYGSAQEKYEREQLAKKQLISNLSHDVRTPLVSVIGYLEAIVQGRIAGDMREDYINTAYEKAELLKEQVNQLFEFVQNDADEIELLPEKVDACETARQVLIDFLPVFEGSGIELESSIPDNELNIFVDRSGFIRILHNIIKNTLTHGEEGKYIGIFVKEGQGWINIDIKDKGRGIDKEDMPFIFERLYKADSSRSKGGGIGLAIAKELANKMNGDIEILRSIPGNTVFRIMFPIAE